MLSFSWFKFFRFLLEFCKSFVYVVVKKIKILNFCCGLEFLLIKNSKVFIIVWFDCIFEFLLIYFILKVNFLGFNLFVFIIVVKRLIREVKLSGMMVKWIIFVIFEIFYNKKSCILKYDVMFV